MDYFYGSKNPITPIEILKLLLKLKWMNIIFIHTVKFNFKYYFIILFGKYHSYKLKYNDSELGGPNNIF